MQQQQNTAVKIKQTVKSVATNIKVPNMFWMASNVINQCVSFHQFTVEDTSFIRASSVSGFSVFLFIRQPKFLILVQHVRFIKGWHRYASYLAAQNSLMQTQQLTSAFRPQALPHLDESRPRSRQTLYLIVLDDRICRIAQMCLNGLAYAHTVL